MAGQSRQFEVSPSARIETTLTDYHHFEIYDESTRDESKIKTVKFWEADDETFLSRFVFSESGFVECATHKSYLFIMQHVAALECSQQKATVPPKSRNCIILMETHNTDL